MSIVISVFKMLIYHDHYSGFRLLNMFLDVMVTNIPCIDTNMNQCVSSNYRTQLFRELKLNKLLLRQLDDRYSATRRGSHYTLRGYSRQTETYASSLSNSVDNSANDATDLDDESVWGVDQRALLFRYQRPGSRAISLPPRLHCEYSPSPSPA